MEMEGMEGAILIFMLGNMEQTVARKQTKREKNNAQKRTEGWKQKGIWLLWYAVVPVFAFYLMECYEHNPFAEVRVGAQLFNIFLFELIGWMLYFLTGRMCFASRVLYGLAVAFGITNHYVMKFRSTPFVPWDLFSAGTAASVAGNYDFTPDRRMVIVTLVFIALFVLTRFLKRPAFFLENKAGEYRTGGTGIVYICQCPAAGIVSDKTLSVSVSVHTGIYDKSKWHGGDLCHGSCLCGSGASGRIRCG